MDSARRRSPSKLPWVLLLLRCTTSTHQKLTGTSSSSLARVIVMGSNFTELLRDPQNKLRPQCLGLLLLRRISIFLLILLVILTMLKDHDREIQEAARRARIEKTRVSNVQRQGVQITPNPMYVANYEASDETSNFESDLNGTHNVTAETLRDPMINGVGRCVSILHMNCSQSHSFKQITGRKGNNNGREVVRVIVARVPRGMKKFKTMIFGVFLGKANISISGLVIIRISLHTWPSLRYLIM